MEDLEKIMSGVETKLDEAYESASKGSYENCAKAVEEYLRLAHDKMRPELPLESERRLLELYLKTNSVLGLYVLDDPDRAQPLCSSITIINSSLVAISRWRLSRFPEWDR